MSSKKAASLLSCSGDHRKFLNHKFLSYDSNMCQPQFKANNSFAFWTTMLTVTVLTIGNLILTLTMIGVLRLGKGIQGIELIPENDIVKFYGTTDLDRIYNKNSGQIDGFIDDPVSIIGEETDIFIKLNRNGQSQSRLIMNKSGMNFKNINLFGIKDPISGDSVFTTHRPHYILRGAPNLVTRGISASKIASSIGESLGIQSETRIYVKGSEGIAMDSLNIFLGNQTVIVNSTHGAIILEESTGLFLNIDKIPVITSDITKRSAVGQYKICVCMPSGALFRIPIPRIHTERKVSCAYFNSKIDPCSPK